MKTLRMKACALALLCAMRAEVAAGRAFMGRWADKGGADLFRRPQPAPKTTASNVPNVPNVPLELPQKLEAMSQSGDVDMEVDSDASTTASSQYGDVEMSDADDQLPAEKEASGSTMTDDRLASAEVKTASPSWAQRLKADAASAPALPLQVPLLRSHLQNRGTQEEPELKLRFECNGTFSSPQVHGLWFKDENLDGAGGQGMSQHLKMVGADTWKNFETYHKDHVLKAWWLWKGSRGEPLKLWAHEWEKHGVFVVSRLGSKANKENKMVQYVNMMAEFRSRVPPAALEQSVCASGVKSFNFCGRRGQTLSECNEL